MSKFKFRSTKGGSHIVGSDEVQPTSPPEEITEEEAVGAVEEASKVVRKRPLGKAIGKMERDELVHALIERGINPPDNENKTKLRKRLREVN